VANYGGQMGRTRKEKESESSQERAERVTRNEPFDIKELDTELRMKEDLKNPREVLPAPRSQLEDKGRADGSSKIRKQRVVLWKRLWVRIQADHYP
jgi:hypothetical protein